MEQLDGICSNLNFNNLYQAFKDKNAINLSRESEPEPAKKKGPSLQQWSWVHSVDKNRKGTFSPCTH